MTGKRTIVALLGAVALMPVHGCLSNHTEQMSEVDPRGWDRDTPVWIQYQNEDTVSQRDISILLRYNDLFTAGRLPLQISVLTPDNLRWEELFTLYLDPNAKEHIFHYEGRFPYRHDVRLAQPGKYIFRIAPTVDGIVGTEAIGLDIRRPERTQP